MERLPMLTEDDFFEVSPEDLTNSGAIYVLQQSDGAIAYVGQSGQVATRMKDHLKRNADRMFFKRILIHPEEDYQNRVRQEAALIALWAPKVNRHVSLKILRDKVWEDYRGKIKIQDV